MRCGSFDVSYPMDCVAENCEPLNFYFVRHAIRFNWGMATETNYDAVLTATGLRQAEHLTLYFEQLAQVRSIDSNGGLHVLRLVWRFDRRSRCA